jgi:hypothetical protein
MQNQHKWSVLAVSQTLVDRIFRFEFNLDASKVLFLVNMMCRKKQYPGLLPNLNYH